MRAVLAAARLCRVRRASGPALPPTCGIARPSANIRVSLFRLAAESSFNIFFCVVCRNAQDLDGVGKWHLQERRNATGCPAVTAVPFSIEVLSDPPITAGQEADAALKTS